MKITITGMTGTEGNDTRDSFNEFNRTSDRVGWQGGGLTAELPADGTWSGGNGGDVDEDNDPAMKLHKNRASGRIVGPEGLCDKGNDSK